MEFPWVKLQDFYLRLGLLKVLVAVLGGERRSAQREAVIRRLRHPLLEPAEAYPALWSRVQERGRWHVWQKGRWAKSERRAKNPITVADALLVEAEAPSWLCAVNAGTAYKVAEWASDIRLVGAGLQVTERGAVLHSLLDAKAAERFLAGDPLAWNPFVLSPTERHFFLLHLCESDQATFLTLADAVGLPGGDHQFRSRKSGEIVCRALFAVLHGCATTVMPKDIPAYREAKELACVIARELSMSDFLAECSESPRRPEPRNPARDRHTAFGGASSAPRSSTRNAEHQAIPRIEALVDLGLLTKAPVVDVEPDERVRALRSWEYRVCPSATRWKGLSLDPNLVQPVLRQKFCWLAGADVTPRSWAEVARLCWDAYARIRRPVGHTPFESVAVLAAVEAAGRGVRCEMATCHSLFTQLRNGSLLPEHAFFAAGSHIENMFVLLKSGFVEAVEAVQTRLDPIEEHHG